MVIASWTHPCLANDLMYGASTHRFKKAGRRAASSILFFLLFGCAPTGAVSPTPARIDEPLPAAQREEMASISPETYLIECEPGLRKYVPGIIPSRPAGWPQEHPGYHILKDGHCAFDPAVTPNPVTPLPIGP
jgi:hypothetical protein